MAQNFAIPSMHYDSLYCIQIAQKHFICMSKLLKRCHYPAIICHESSLRSQKAIHIKYCHIVALVLVSHPCRTLYTPQTEILTKRLPNDGRARTVQNFAILSMHYDYRRRIFM